MSARTSAFLTVIMYAPLLALVASLIGTVSVLTIDGQHGDAKTGRFQ